MTGPIEDKGGNAIRCPRCGGLMLPADIITVEEKKSRLWRCTVCGNVVDPEIIKNRLASKPPRRASARRPKKNG